MLCRSKDNRSVAYKKSGWKLSDDGRFITFTDGRGIGALKLIGKQMLRAFRDKIQRVQIVRRSGGYYAHFVLQVNRNEPNTDKGRKAIGRQNFIGRLQHLDSSLLPEAAAAKPRGIR